MLPKSTLYIKLHIVQQGYVTGIIRRRQPLRAVNDRKLTNPRQLHQRKCHLKKNIYAIISQLVLINVCIRWLNYLRAA